MYRDLFGSGDQEPWVFRGGVQAEIQVCILVEEQPGYVLSFLFLHGGIAKASA